MSSKKKKILSALLASSMLMSQVSVVAFAADDPTDALFTYQKPEGASTVDDKDVVTYDGTAKSATVAKANPENNELEFEVKYSKKQSSESPSGSDFTDAPTDAGTYYVYACVTGNSTYNEKAVQVGSFTISVATPEVADFTFTAPETNPKYGDAKPTVTSAKNGIGTVSCDYYNAEGEKVTQEKLPVGTYTIKVSTTDATNYSNASDLTNKSWTFKVEPAEISNIKISDVAIPTVGSELDTSAADTSASGYTLSTVSWEPSGTAGYNTSYTATVTATPDANHVFKDGGVTITFNSGDATSSKKNEDGSYTITKTFTTEKESVSGVTLTGVAAPVAGANVPTIGVDSGANGKYSIESTTWYTVGEEETAFKDEKFGANTTYKVVIVLAPGENCKFAESVNVSGVDGVSSGTPNGESGKITIEKTFAKTAKAAATEDLFTRTIADTTYNGQEQAVTVTSETIGDSYITVKYASDDKGTGLSTNVPKDAGTYYVFACVTENEAHKYAATNVLLGSFTIAPKTVTINTEGYTVTKVYDGEDTAGTGSGSMSVDGVEVGDTVTVKIGTVGTYSGTDVGNYQVDVAVELEGASAANYTLGNNASGEPITSVKVNATITQATPTISVTATQHIVKGNGDFIAPTANVDGTFTYTYSDVTYDGTEGKTVADLKAVLASVEPGEATVTYTFTPTDTKNYKTVSDGSLTLTVVDIQFTVGGTAISSENPAANIKENPTYGDTWGEILSSLNTITATVGDNSTSESSCFSVENNKSYPNAGAQSYKILFTGTIGGTKYENIVVYTDTVEIAQRELTVTPTEQCRITKEYDSTKSSENCTMYGTLGIGELVIYDNDKVSIEWEIGDYESPNVGDSNVTFTVTLKDETGNYKLKDGNDKVSVPAKITQRTITPSAEVTGKFNYTGSAPSFTADDIVVTFTDEAIENGAKQTLTFGTDFTVECTSVNAGSATATIKKVAGSNFTFDDKDVTFTIGAADLSVEYAEQKTAGVASGTYGAKLSEFTTFSGLTVKIAGTDTTVNGTWKITGAGSDAVPNVGDDGTYTATFTPDTNAGNYNTLTAKVTLDIEQATHEAVSDTAVTVYKDNTESQTAQLVLPKIDGIKVKTDAAISVEDTNTILDGTPTCTDAGVVTFKLASGKEDGNTATVTVTFSSTNYKPFTATLKITLSDLQDQAAPDAPTLTSELEAGGNTYKVTITAPDTVDKNKTLEYSFDGITFSSKYETTGVAPNTTVTGYIRYAAIQDEANASPAVSATITTPMAASTEPTLPTSEGEFEDSKEITISADEGAKIYYTLDGSTPTENSTLYTAPFTITKTTTVKAIAVNYGKAPSSVVEATYTKKAVTEYTVTFSNATVKNGTTTLTSGDKVVAGTKLTVTAIPQSGKTATLYINGKAVTGTSTTITVNANVTITVTYTTNSSGNNPGGTGGSGGGSSGGSSSINTSPSVDGKTQTWSDIAKDIAKLPADKTETISLNGNTTVPVDVVKAIATSNAEVTLKVNNVFSWTIDGSEIDPKDAKAADLSITTTTVTGTNVLRGIVGTGFTIKGTNVKSELNINFKATNAGKFANLFKKVDGKLVFVDNVKVDEKGAAIGLEVSEKGEYVVMLGDFSDRSGDMDNDGVMNANDALAVIKDFLEIEAGANPLVADVNHDGRINAKDSLQIIIEFLNLE